MQDWLRGPQPVALALNELERGLFSHWHLSAHTVREKGMGTRMKTLLGCLFCYSPPRPWLRGSAQEIQRENGWAPGWEPGRPRPQGWHMATWAPGLTLGCRDPVSQPESSQSGAPRVLGVRDRVGVRRIW